MEPKDEVSLLFPIINLKLQTIIQNKSKTSNTRKIFVPKNTVTPTIKILAKKRTKSPTELITVTLKALFTNNLKA